MRNSKLKDVIPSLMVAALLAVFVVGCAWSIGGSKDGEKHIQATTGQELLDLKRAKDAGAITDAEYEAQKQRLLNK
jgi:uncharacterized membrane protein